MRFTPAFWMQSQNLGDSITKLLVEKISGTKCVFVNPDEDCDKYMVTGSILNWGVKNALVWGCGLANKTDIVTQKKHIFAVRGGLTGDICKRHGVSFDEVYGDPALLLPKYISVPEVEKNKIGVLPHYVDQYHVKGTYNLWGNDVLFLDILDNLDTLISQLKSCRIVYSSTLHGIIFCHAFGIPCYWVKFTNNVLGDDMKFYDHYSSLYFPIANVTFLDFRGVEHIDFTIQPINPLIPNPDTLSYVQEKLINNCPFKN